MVNKQTKFFDCNYPQGREEVQADYCESLDDFVVKVCEKFGVDSDKFRYGFDIHDDKEKFRESHGMSKEDYKDWMVGLASREDKTIRILTPEVAGRTTESMKAVAKHEVVHALSDCYELGNNKDPFTSEGLALYLSGQYKEETRIQQINETSFPKISELSDNKTFAQSGGYLFAGIYVGYFIETQGGVEAFKNVIACKENFADIINEADAIKWYLNKFKQIPVTQQGSEK